MVNLPEFLGAAISLLSSLAAVDTSWSLCRSIGASVDEVLRQSFGEMHLDVARMNFLRMIDRQVFQRRRPRFTKVSESIDDAFGRWRPLHGLSYHRVIVVRKATDAR